LQDACPVVTELEIIVLDWACKFLGFPDFFLSHFSNPASEGGGSIQVEILQTNSSYLKTYAMTDKTMPKTVIFVFYRHQPQMPF